MRVLADWSEEELWARLDELGRDAVERARSGNIAALLVAIDRQNEVVSIRAELERRYPA